MAAKNHHQPQEAQSTPDSQQSFRDSIIRLLAQFAADEHRRRTREGMHRSSPTPAPGMNREVIYDS